MTIQFRYTVGDWSQDGHNMSDDFYFETNATFEEIQTADKKLYQDFPPFGDWFEDYEDSQISEEDLEALRAILPEAAKEFAAYKGEVYLDGGPDGYAHIWAALINHFNPEIELKQVVNNLPVIHGGGYGLYSN